MNYQIVYHKIVFCNFQVNHYKFSISWSRIMPDGTITSTNKAGITYYKQLIDAVLDAGIEPVVTLYNWDLPQKIQDYGGWLNTTTITLFNDFANLCFRQFGNRV